MKNRLTIVFILLLGVNLTLYSQSNRSEFSPPGWSYNKTIYEVNVRQYSKEANFKGFEKHLPELKDLGVGILWFMPIQPIGEKNRKGTLGSYYSVKDYKAVNPEFGSLGEFKMLVKEIHRMGMYLILDWVANHTAWDNAWIKEHPDFYTKDSLGNIISPNPDWTDVADLNYDNQALRDTMIEALKFWLQECDIDGYRCDVAGMIPIDFWVDARTELQKIKPVFMLAEWETPEMCQAFDMTYDWKMYDTMNDIVKGKKNATDLFSCIKNNEENYPPNSFRMEFTTNHDKNSWDGTVFERLGNAAEEFAVYTFMIPGMPLIYTGQEAGLDKRLAFFEKDSVSWKNHSFRKLYKSLVQLKKNNDALFCGERGGELIHVSSSNDSSVLAFTRTKHKSKIFAIFNFSDKAVDCTLQGDSMKGSYRNFFNGKVLTLKNGETFKLEPWRYKIFTK
jgi:cyclomaltodextrinase